MTVPAYLDHAASTPLRPEAHAAMEPFLSAVCGNPTGSHRSAQRSKRAVEEAREQVAEVLGAHPDEIVFTGSGSEGDNLAVKGAAWAAREAGRGDGVVVTAFEHKAVLAAADRLAREGFSVKRSAVSSDGMVDLDGLADALDDHTVVVSAMLVNNEVGTIQPLAEIAELVSERSPRAVLHTDAVQAPQWVHVGEAATDAALVATSGHKFGGPKGVGALVVRRGTELVPLVEGGGQEWGLRSGTHNVAGIVAFATALRIAHERRRDECTRIAALRDRLEDVLVAGLPDLVVNGDPKRRTPGMLHVSIPGVEAETLLVALDQRDVYAAAGSSCSSGATEPSYVLEAMGMSRDRALASIRLSLGYASTELDVERAAAVIVEEVARLRAAAA